MRNRFARIIPPEEFFKHYTFNGRGDLVNPRKARKRILRKLYVTRKMKRINRAEAM